MMVADLFVDLRSLFFQIVSFVTGEPMSQSIVYTIADGDENGIFNNLDEARMQVDNVMVVARKPPHSKFSGIDKHAEVYLEGSMNISGSCKEPGEENPSCSAQSAPSEAPGLHQTKTPAEATVPSSADRREVQTVDLSANLDLNGGSKGSLDPPTRTKTNTSSPVMNPYNKRRRTGPAQSTPATSAAAETHADPSRMPISPGLDDFERYFAILLRSSIEDYVLASGCAEASRDLWNMLCLRAEVPALDDRIAARYPDAESHFKARVPLLLEEARSQLCTPLGKRWQKPGNSTTFLSIGSTATTSCLSCMVLAGIEDNKKHGVTKLRFQTPLGDNSVNHRNFSSAELELLDSGVVFECVCTDGPLTISRSILAVISPNHKSAIAKDKQFEVKTFRPLDHAGESSKWRLSPITNLTSALREFLAVSTYSHVSFLDALLGNPTATRATPDQADQVTENNISDITKGSRNVFPSPTLNAAQDEAASTFLRASSGSITIVQGPPGTGKSTLLVATICRFLNTAWKKELPKKGSRSQLMVSAPTNKAVSVLVNRFVATITDETMADTPCNILLVGDIDKLLDKPCPRSTLLLQSHVYSFQNDLVQEYDAIAAFYDPQSRGRRTGSDRIMFERATKLRKRVLKRLLHLDDEVKAGIEGLCHLLEEKISGARDVSRSEIYKKVGKLSGQIAMLPSDAVKHDLVSSADVIFCTLCSAGSSCLKTNLYSLDGLIVDEAAAATEPALYIPFRFLPQKLMVVGDPKQLPATVESNLARRLGLDWSLHERLMFSCGHKYIMLDTQYRMHPEICSFPSRHFYYGKLSNGENVSNALYGSNQPLLLDRRPFIFYNVEGQERKSYDGGSSFNLEEAAAIVNLVRSLRAYVQGSEWSSPERLRIITFYRAQVALITKKLEEAGLKEALVGTVDSNQGCESDVVIVSFVRSGAVGFLKDDRRMNVALTRAKHQVVCVGNVSQYPRMFDAPTLRQLALDTQRRQTIINHLMTKR